MYTRAIFMFWRACEHTLWSPGARRHHQRSESFVGQIPQTAPEGVWQEVDEDRDSERKLVGEGLFAGTTGDDESRVSVQLAEAGPSFFSKRYAHGPLHARSLTTLPLR